MMILAFLLSSPSFFSFLYIFLFIYTYLCVPASVCYRVTCKSHFHNILKHHVASGSSVRGSPVCPLLPTFVITSVYSLKLSTTNAMKLPFTRCLLYQGSTYLPFLLFDVPSAAILMVLFAMTSQQKCVSALMNLCRFRHN
jgi:hypothetical protein